MRGCDGGVRRGGGGLVGQIPFLVLNGIFANLIPLLLFYPLREERACIR